MPATLSPRHSPPRADTKPRPKPLAPRPTPPASVSGGRARPATNVEIAASFDRVADLLEAREANAFRVRAYREGARTLRALDRPVAQILAEGGHAALVALPHVGQSLAAAIEEYVANGTFPVLDRLEGTASPEELFTTVPGIGPKLAARIHDELHVDTLEELELAAHDGRLEALHGFGPRRAHAVRNGLDAILRRSTRRRARLIAQGPGRATVTPPRPALTTLLELDARYRELARAGELRTIAPRRFNPEHDPWLPIWHTERDGWDFDVMFSNTARAHRLGKTREWVVIYYGRNGDDGQCTVVTEHAGRLRGRRVVRGRENEVV